MATIAARNKNNPIPFLYSETELNVRKVMNATVDLTKHMFRKLGWVPNRIVTFIL